MTALEAPFGQGVGAGYTLGAGIRAGGEQWYLDFRDSLYVGYSQIMVTRNASRIQNRYQNEYGAYGRTQYKKDIQAALDSGTLDENYAEALKKRWPARRTCISWASTRWILKGIFSKTARKPDATSPR